MGTFQTIQDRVARRVIDAPASVQAEIPLIVNDVYLDAQKRRNFQVMRTLAGAFNTTAGNRTLTTRPANFKELRSHPYYIPNIGKPQRMQWLATDLIANSTASPQDEGAPRYLADSTPSDDGTLNWAVWPLPDGGSDYDDGEYRVVVPYWRYLPPLVNPTDTSWLTENGEQYLVLRATANAFELDWNDQNSITFEGLAKIAWQALTQADTTQALAGMDTLVPYQGAWADMDRS